MKEVTICFSFSVKDGQTRKFMRVLGILSGMSGDGEQSIESRRFALRSTFLLIERVADLTDDFHIQSIALRERVPVNTPDDLEAKKGTYAKGDKP